MNLQSSQYILNIAQESINACMPFQMHWNFFQFFFVKLDTELTFNIKIELMFQCCMLLFILHRIAKIKEEFINF